MRWVGDLKQTRKPFPHGLSRRKPQESGVKALTETLRLARWKAAAATSFNFNQTVRRETLWILKAISQISGTPHPTLC